MEQLVNELRFDDRGLLPVVVQDYISNEVLMLAYMNRLAFDKSLETGMAHYWSRSRNKLWLKGETSGHYQYIKSMNIDCDGDTLLLKVEQKEAACHTGHYSCFFRQLSREGIKELPDLVFSSGETYGNRADILEKLYDTILDRLKNPKEGSYTNYLFEKGLDKILKKVGEETAEVIIAAKNKSKDEISYEVADLVYHLLVLMVERKVEPDDICSELEKRHKP
ncbi:MAG: bifunctional phosphoribosyl-AMP cyclohydrolase/phosphoribosyl-ATP diphosphatase HisIE [Acetivibrionales bacterium]